MAIESKVSNKLDDLVGAEEALVAIMVVVGSEGNRHLVAN